MICAIAASRNMRLRLYDIKTAFLHAELKEIVYVRPPYGITKPGYVWKLNKALPGLKQAGRAWHETFVARVLKSGFKQCRADACLFYTRVNGSLLLILVHIDDCICTYNDKSDLKVYERLLSHFSYRDEGDLVSALGLQVRQLPGSIQIHQRDYLVDMLKRFGYDSCKPVATPAVPKKKIVADKTAHALEKFGLNALVGAMLWAARMSRPDLSYAVGVNGQDTVKPTLCSYTAAARVLRYISGTLDLCIEYKRGAPLALESYSDSDWAGESSAGKHATCCTGTDAKSRTGYVLYLAGGPIAWLSKKQSGTALSTAEAELYAFGECIQTMDLICTLLTELSLPAKRPVPLMIDNQSAVRLAETNVIGKRTRHIHIRWGFINDHVSARLVRAVPVDSADNHADIFTKALERIQFVTLRNAIMVQLDSSE